MFRTLAVALLAAALLAQAASARAEPLTLEEAIARASNGAPVLTAADAGVDVARAERRQAVVRPNPTVSVMAENAVGTGDYGLFSRSEVTGTYNQTIERGGKRAARAAFAERGITVAEARQRIARLDLAAQVQRAYYDVLIAEEQVWAGEFRVKTETQLQTEALRRVRGYKDPLFVETRAAARVAQARIDLAEATGRLAAARSGLASFWGGAGESLEVKDVLLKDAPQRSGVSQVDEALGVAEVARAQSGVVVEEARRTQDYTVSGGLRYLRETDDVAVLGGVTIPIGRFDRNQGNIERAQAQRRQLELTAEATRLARLRRLVSLRAEAATMRTKADAIIKEVVPRTTRTLEQVRAGYNRGGFAFRDVQDAADAILEAQREWFAAATAWRDLQTEIDRLSGRFDAVADGETVS